MPKKNKYDLTVTKNNYMEVVRAITAKNLEHLKLNIPELGNATIDSQIEKEIECSKHRRDHRYNTEWVDAIADFFNGDRRTFLDMELWVFGVFSDEFFWFSEEGEKLSNRLFSSLEKNQKIEDRIREALQIIQIHFGGDIKKFLQAGGYQHIKKLKKKNSIVDLNKPRDQF